MRRIIAEADHNIINNNYEYNSQSLTHLNGSVLDEDLLFQARIYWYFGDWDSLCKINMEAMRKHPERATLALLIAAGLVQTGDADNARKFVQQARDWGVGDSLVCKILIAGVYNTLGRIAAIQKKLDLANERFRNSIMLVDNGAEAELLIFGRIMNQLKQLKLNT